MRQTSAGARVGQKERKGARKNKGKGGLVWETTRGGGYFSGGWLVCLGVLHSQGSRLQVARGMTRHHKKTLACVVRARNAGNNPTDTLLRLEARVSDTVQYLPPTGSGSVRGEKHEETDRGRADKGGHAPQNQYLQYRRVLQAWFVSKNCDVRRHVFRSQCGRPSALTRGNVRASGTTSDSGVMSACYLRSGDVRTSALFSGAGNAVYKVQVCVRHRANRQQDANGKAARRWFYRSRRGTHPRAHNSTRVAPATTRRTTSTSVNSRHVCAYARVLGGAVRRKQQHGRRTGVTRGAGAEAPRKRKERKSIRKTKTSRNKKEEERRPRAINLGE